MALIFPRLAKNFAKNGYYPTDELTLSGIASALEAFDGTHVRMLDPCCGEGAALAVLKDHMQVNCEATATALGVEFDSERAWHAKGILDVAAHSDIHDMFVTARSCGLLFLNPPYGDVVNDKALLSDKKEFNRLEKIFFHKSVPWLAFGGVLVLIVPHYVMDKEFATMIARNFDDVDCFLAPEQAFRQLVVFGVKRRYGTADSKVIESLAAIGAGSLPSELPVVWHRAPYLVPATGAEQFGFVSQKIDPRQMESELDRLASNTLWPQFDDAISSKPVTPRRPLRDLTDWHLALALAAGQISGLVRGKDGQQWLIKGDTHKRKETETKLEEGTDGEITTITLSRDKFVPTIVGINFTDGEQLGELITIR